MQMGLIYQVKIISNIWNKLSTGFEISVHRQVKIVSQIAKR